MPVSCSDLSLFDLDGEDVPSGLMRPNFNFSVSLLFMDSLSFRLMCKPDSYQCSRPGPASGRLERFWNGNFGNCEGTANAKRYKPVRGMLGVWSTDQFEPAQRY